MVVAALGPLLALTLACQGSSDGRAPAADPPAATAPEVHAPPAPPPAPPPSLPIPSAPGAGPTKVEKVEQPKEVEPTRRPPEAHAAKVEVLFRSVPEAEVYVDGRRVRGSSADEAVTPIKALISEGKHQVRFRCADGSEGREALTVVPSPQRLVVDGQCSKDQKR